MLCAIFVFFVTSPVVAQGKEHKAPRKVEFRGGQSMEEKTHKHEEKRVVLETDQHKNQAEQQSWKEAKAKATESVRTNDLRARWKIAALVLFLTGLIIAYWPSRERS